MPKKYHVLFSVRESGILNSKWEEVCAKSIAAVRMWSVAVGRERGWNLVKIINSKTKRDL